MNFAPFYQNTPEWLAAHLNRFSASEIEKLIWSDEVYATGKRKGENKGKDTAIEYIQNCVDGCFQEKNDTQLSSMAIKWGHENEPIARAFYAQLHFLEETHFSVIKEEVGRIENIENETGLVYDFSIFESDELLMISPDSWIPKQKKVVEYKCPQSNGFSIAKRIKTVEDLKAYNSTYYWQIICQMWGMGADSADWVNFNPLFDERHCMSILTIKREDVISDIKLLEKRLKWATEVYLNEYLLIK